ncbi:MAG TPA: hypothetical protein VFI91_10170 [Longimicrobiaceae bacterium]|nr:hypothetical protein [Longimicrobiaceae bacterium]
MAIRPADELLYDSEASLRLVEEALCDLLRTGSSSGPSPHATPEEEMLLLLNRVRAARTQIGLHPELAASSVLAEVESRLAGLIGGERQLRQVLGSAAGVEG